MPATLPSARPGGHGRIPTGRAGARTFSIRASNLGRDAVGRGIVGKGARRRAALGVTVALVAAGASGCWWGQPGFGPEHARFNDLESGLTPATVGSLSQAWTLAFPDG